MGRLGNGWGGVDTDETTDILEYLHVLKMNNQS